MTEDEIKELNEQIAEAGGSKYANGCTVISGNNDMSILFMTHEVPTTCVTMSYKSCSRLIERLQESLDSAKSKEVSADIGISALQYKALFTQSAIDTLAAMGYTYEGGVRWKPPLGKPPEWVEK